MTLQLADLLRASLDAAGVHEVSLQEELLFLQKYVDIQQIRFQDRLQVETDVDPVVLLALVPNLLLQPLVENAIRHGISPRRDPGLIRLSVWRDPDDLWIEVRDNGVGFLAPAGTPLSKELGCATRAPGSPNFITTITCWCWTTRRAADAAPASASPIASIRDRR